MVYLQSDADRELWKVEREITQILAPRYGAGEAKAMMRLMFYHLKGWSVTDIVIHSNDILSDYILESLDAILVRVMSGEPLQYVVGEARFYGLNLKVNKNVLIPRQETEQLVDLIVRYYDRHSDLRVLDIGTGSGAIAIALARNLLFPSVTAIDVSQDALDVARDNAETLKAKVNFEHKDVFEYQPKPDSFELIVSNPPYVAESEKAGMDRNVLDYEPHLALFVPDSNPLIYYSRIAEVASIGLVKGGRLWLEINPLFASQFDSMLRSAGFENVDTIKDMEGSVRFVVAEKK